MALISLRLANPAGQARYIFVFFFFNSDNYPLIKMVQRVARWKALEKLLLAKHHSSSCTDQLEIILSALVSFSHRLFLSIFSSSNRTKLWANTYNTKSKLFLYLNVEEIFVHFFFAIKLYQCLTMEDIHRHTGEYDWHVEAPFEILIAIYTIHSTLFQRER